MEKESPAPPSDETCCPNTQKEVKESCASCPLRKPAPIYTVVMDLRAYLYHSLSLIGLGIVLPDLVIAIQEFTRNF
jgi:hypothetical protein